LAKLKEFKVNRIRYLWVLIGIVILSAAVVSGFVILAPSAEDILVTMLENAEAVKDGYAVVSIDIDSIEKDASGTFEIWAVRGEEDEQDRTYGTFRVEVLTATEEKAENAVIVSDGETLWAYSPSENKVFVGTPEEAQAMMAENEYMLNEFGTFHEDREGKSENGDSEHTESAEEAVDKLLDYFKINKAGTETAPSETVNLLKMEPISEQMPEEFAAVGGYLNLWVGQDSNLPLGLYYVGGSLGEFSVTVLEYEINTGIEESRFTFEIPTGAEVVTFADLEPQSLTLEQAKESVEFAFLTPSENLPGATLVDIFDMRGVIVQRYTLPEGGGFTIAQGIANDPFEDGRTPSGGGQSIEVREITGQIFESEDGNQVLLSWEDDNLFYTIAGNLSVEDALSIAASLE
jgi:outer membrane lipoprotein-sorting protein